MFPPILDILKNQEQATAGPMRNFYLPGSLAAKLQEQQLINQYYGPNIESEMYARNQLGNLHGQQAKWWGPNIQSEIGYRGAQTAGQQLENDLNRQINPYKINAAQFLPEEAQNRASLYGHQGKEASARAAKEQAEASNMEQIAEAMKRYNNPNYQSPPQAQQQFQQAQQQSAMAQGSSTPTLNDNIQDAFIKQRGSTAAVKVIGAGGMIGTVPADKVGVVLDSGGRLAEEPPRQPAQQAQQQPQNIQQAYQEQAPISQEDQLMKIADMNALYRGQTPPSLEASVAAKKELATAQAKEFVNTTSQYSKNAEFSTKSLRDLDNLEASISKISNLGMSQMIPESLKKRFGSGDIQEAIQHANRLLLGQLKPAFGGLGQLRVMEMQKLMESLPGIQLTKEKALKVVGQLRLEFKAAQMQGEISERLSRYTKDPNELRAITNMAAKTFSPVDETGSHPERLNKWKEFGSPEALKALRNNQIYIPPGTKPSDLSPDVRREMIASMP